ncbi:MAG TPA: AAA family ATPase [Pyrinomonadaceae bacterium]|nr:AAA family ATPase [Pyrinomonadaceae bacterium]
MAKSEFEFGDQDYGSAFGWDPGEEDRKEREKILEKAKKKDPAAHRVIPSMLYLKSMSEFVEDCQYAGELEQMFGPLWLENEVAVMYGTPGTGKSVLAMQIAESIARGTRISPFDTVKRRKKLRPKRVLYLDFELTREQIALRYSVHNGTKLVEPYKFADELFRTEMYWNGYIDDGYEDFTDMLFDNIRLLIEENGIQVLIIDNISYLSRKSTSNPAVAAKVMGRLQQLRREKFVSILVIAHTPKHPDTKPLKEMDIQGSIDLVKFADSMFVLGKSRVGANYFYLKHIKSRSGVKFGENDEVAVFQIAKRDVAATFGLESKGTANFLSAKFVAYEAETDHVSFVFTPQRQSNSWRRNARRVEKARAMARNGMGVVLIAKALRTSQSSVHSMLKSG